MGADRKHEQVAAARAAEAGVTREVDLDSGMVARTVQVGMVTMTDVSGYGGATEIGSANGLDTAALAAEVSVLRSRGSRNLSFAEGMVGR